MFVFWLSQRRFARSFEATGDGYIFRSYPWNEALPVSANEKATLLRTFRGKYFKYHAALWCSFFALIIGWALVIVIMGSTELGRYTGDVIGAVFVFAFLSAIFTIEHRLRTLPKRELSYRSPVRKARGFKGAFIARTAKLSWTYIMIWVGCIVSLGWLLLPPLSAPVWVWTLWIAYFALCVGSLALHVYAKLKLSSVEE